MLNLLSALRLLKSYRNKLISEVFPLPKEMRISDSVVEKYSLLKPSRSLIVMVPGLHPDGIRDLRFRALAQSLTEAGFGVIAPDIEEFRRLEITTNVVKQLERLLDAMPSEFRDYHLGFLAISYGAGPVFAVAAKRKADFIVSIGGYCDLAKTLKASLTSKESWGRMILALNQLYKLQPNDESLLRKILLMKMTKNEDASKLEEQLSDTDLQFLKALNGGLSGSLHSSFVDVIDRNFDVCRELSPATYLDKLNPQTRIYLIHGVTDPLIPYQQTEELEMELRKAGHAKVFKLITRALTHADTVSRGKVREKWKLLRWMQRVLSEK